MHRRGFLKTLGAGAVIGASSSQAIQAKSSVSTKKISITRTKKLTPFSTRDHNIILCRDFPRSTYETQ